MRKHGPIPFRMLLLFCEEFWVCGKLLCLLCSDGEFVFPVTAGKGSLSTHGPLLLVFWMSDDRAEGKSLAIFFTFVEAASNIVILQQKISAIEGFGHTSNTDSMWLVMSQEKKICLQTESKFAIFSFLTANLRCEFHASADGLEEEFVVCGERMAIGHSSDDNVSSYGYITVPGHKTGEAKPSSRASTNSTSSPSPRQPPSSPRCASTEDLLQLQGTSAPAADRSRPPVPLPRDSVILPDLPAAHTSPAGFPGKTALCKSFSM